MKKKNLNIILIVCITLLVLYFALKDDYKSIISLLLQANISWLLIGYLLVLSYTFLKSIVTKDIINSFKKYSILQTFKLQLMTFFFNSITPFSTGGQPFQIYALNKNNIDLTQASNIVVQESIIHQVAFSIVLMITIPLNIFLNIYDMDFSLNLFLIISFLINGLVTILLFILAYGKKLDSTFANSIISILAKLRIIKNKEEKIEKWKENIVKFNIASKNLLLNKKRFVKLIIINIVAIICFYLVPLVTLFSLGDYNSFDGIVSIVLVSFVSIISCYVPLPGGAIGQEYLFSLFFSCYVTKPILGSLLILWRLETYYLPMIVGAIIFNISKKN